MISHDHHIRVRYAETDKMGVVYYGKYAEYFEVSRAELIRHFGYTYAEMEADGVMMPVTEMRVRYVRPARYDDHLTLRATIYKRPQRRVMIETKVYNEAGKLVTKGEVTLAFLDAKTGRSVVAPPRFLELLDKNWQEKGS